MEAWKKVWREGFAPLLSLPALEALRLALATDDARLLQGITTSPPPLQCVQDWPVEGAEAIAFALWQGEGLETVGEVENRWAKTCFECDQRLGEPAICRWFLNWHDDTPRYLMLPKLLAEVNEELDRRGYVRNGPMGVQLVEGGGI